MNRIRIKPLYPMFADRWFPEMGENKFVKRVAGKTHAIGEDGKLIASAKYVATTPEGLKEIESGDWIVYQKTDKGATVRVYSPSEFQSAFREYREYESTQKEETV